MCIWLMLVRFHAGLCLFFCADLGIVTHLSGNIGNVANMSLSLSAGICSCSKLSWCWQCLQLFLGVSLGITRFIWPTSPYLSWTKGASKDWIAQVISDFTLLMWNLWADLLSSIEAAVMNSILKHVFAVLQRRTCCGGPRTMGTPNCTSRL